MASARKKFDEKNLKILRELLSQPSNKHCFDCNQRGPTYVNVTIGSFVCTTCSGLLRGLTPPHRVKSVTMAAFTQEEIDFVSARGNEYCKKVWLGLSNSPTIDSSIGRRDEQMIKDYMISVYERKRYYVNPYDIDCDSKLQTPRLEKVPSSNHVAMATRVAVNNINNNLNGSRNNNTNKLISSSKGSTANFNKTDPFGSLPAADPSFSSSFAVDDFANFDDNPVFANSFADENQHPTGKMSTLDKVSQPPSEDRYAALKDLDHLMKSQLATTEPSSSVTSTAWGPPDWTPNFEDELPVSGNKIFGSPSNPFSTVTENGWAGEANQAFGKNPFKTVADSNWPTVNASHNVLPGSQSLNFNNHAKSSWDYNVSPNPFNMNGIEQTANRHSSNPFL